MKVRAIKAFRYDPRRYVVAALYMPHPFQQEGYPFDDDEWDEESDYSCTHCGGEGFREVDDPLWDKCDEFGYGPCGSCRGTGKRSQQWVF